MTQGTSSNKTIDKIKPLTNIELVLKSGQYEKWDWNTDWYQRPTVLFFVKFIYQNIKVLQTW